MKRIANFLIKVLTILSICQVATGQETVDDRISPQRLTTALEEFAERSGLQVIYVAKVANGINTPGADANLSDPEMLEQLLATTGLEYEYINDYTVTVQKATTNEEEFESGKSQPASIQILLAQNQTPAQPSRADKPAETTNRNDKPKEEAIEEIVVVGSHLRGVAPVGSPIRIVDRAEIELSGFGTVQQLFENMPETFGGDASEDVENAGDTINLSGGTGIDLRGLGSGATLTLLNGRRLPRAGGFIGYFTDVSTLPLSAIERVEILTDGASALYGSDAIAGVVNFVLRDDYDGFETRLRFGDSIEGGGEEFEFAQTIGVNWNSGNLLFSYDYYDRGRLPRSERDYAADADKTPYGGDNFRSQTSNPGTIVMPTLAGIPFDQDGTSLTSADLLIGEPNLFNQSQAKDILREEDRHSAFLAIQQELSPRFSLFGEFGYSLRDFSQHFGGETTTITVPDTHPFFVSPDPTATSVQIRYNMLPDTGPVDFRGDAKSMFGSVGTNVEFGMDWQAEFAVYYAEASQQRRNTRGNSQNLAEAVGVDNPDTPFDPVVDGYFNPFADGSNTPQNVLDYVWQGHNGFDLTSDLTSFFAKADGPLFRMPGGDARLAIGVELREENYLRENFRTEGPNRVSDLSPDESSDVTAFFTELHLPIVTQQNSQSGVQRLEFTAAGRHEDYDRFGTSTVPKFGALWELVTGLTLRSSWGESFKAPTLGEATPTGQFIAIIPIPDPASATGTTVALLMIGSNPSLTPETSETWSIGADIEPPRLPLTVNLTYFDIDFENRIGLIPGDITSVLLNPTLNAPILTFNPDPAVVQAFVDSPYFVFDLSGGAPVEVIADGRLRNLALTSVSGFDLGFTYQVETTNGTWDFGFNGSFMSEFENAISVTSPFIDVLGTVGNPADYRLRGNVTWTNPDKNLRTALFFNHLDGYTDNVSVPARNISSWTTFDLTLTYDSNQSLRNIGLNNTRFALTIRNLFDQDPPFVNNLLGYDPANANAYGQYASLTVTKTWGR